MFLDRVDDEIKEEFQLWKLVTRDKATWKELNEYYSMEDVEKMNAAIEIADKLVDIQSGR